MNRDMLTIKDVMDILKKRIVMIVLIVLISTIGAGIYSYFVVKPAYRTSMQIFIGKETNQGTINYQNGEVQLYQMLMGTYAGLIKNEDLIGRALEDIDIDMSPAAVLGSLNITTGEKDQFLNMSISTLNPNDGKVILTAITDEFIKTSSQLIPNGTVSVVQEPKIPKGPYSPNKKMNILVAFAMSLMVSVTLSLFLEYLDNTVKKKEDVENILGVPVIGIVPEYTDKMIKKEKKRGKRIKNKIENNLPNGDLEVTV